MLLSLHHCNISSNIRLILDLLDYASEVNCEALILFLDFYKAFHMIEHHFLIQSLDAFRFGHNFIDIINMFYRDINSSVIIDMNTPKGFQINRGVCQHCLISPFILATELLSIHIVNDNNFVGTSVFGKEFKKSQLTDDTTLLLKDKLQLSNSINQINSLTLQG